MHPSGPFPPAHLDACHEDPVLEAPRRRARVQIVHAAGRRCGALEARRTGAASLREGQGQEKGVGGGAVGRGGGTEWLREVVHGGHRELHGGVWDGVGAEGPVGGAKARGGRMSGLLRGLARGRARRGREEGEAWSAVLYGGSLTVPRAKAAGTRGRGVPGDGAWHWDVRAPDTVSTPPIGSARALSSGASHPAPSPWVELGSTQGVVWCGVVWCGVVWCGVVWCGVVWCGVVWCGVVWCGVVWCGVVWCGVVWCVVLCCVVWCRVVSCRDVSCCVVLCCVVLCPVVWCCVVLCCAVLFCAVLFCAMLFCAALCCDALHCVPLRCVVLCCVVLCRPMLCCVVVWCAEGAATRRQRPGCLPTGAGKREGCVCRVRVVWQCVSCGRRQEGGDVEATH